MFLRAGSHTYLRHACACTVLHIHIYPLITHTHLVSHMLRDTERLPECIQRLVCVAERCVQITEAKECMLVASPGACPRLSQEIGLEGKN